MPLIYATVNLAQQAGSKLSSVMMMAAGIALAGAVVGAIHGQILLYLQSQDCKRSVSAKTLPR
jgi:hypothetical protein